VIPAHVCPAVNLHTRLNIRDGENLLDQWNIDARGCVT
jgi:D-serine deaminase-like pyridoxal phosphate-dependent protein